MARYRTAFAERNKVVVALAGILAMSLVFALTFSADALPIVGGGKVYSAQFTEAGGIRSGNEVRVAGVKVGKVSEVGLDGSTVTVKFRVKGVELGDQTTAAVKVKTMLGQKFLSLDPLGRGTLDGPIPKSRTTTPYDVTAAFSDLSSTIDQIDTDKVEQSFEALSAAFKDTPESVRTTVTGLTALSRTISSRDEEFAKLLDSTATVTTTLKDRNAEFAKIINDGSALLGELQSRREAVTQMLAGTARLGVQLKGLVTDNEKILRPALARLDEVSVILQRNQGNLDKALAKLGPYYRVITSAMGNGKWVDAYICGLFDAQGKPVLQNNVERTCEPGKGGGR